MLKGFVLGEEKDIKRIPMKGWNLVDESKARQNAYISSDDATIGSSTVSNVTDYIEINGSPFVISGVKTTDIMSPNSRGICFFNSDKEFIGGSSYYPNVMSSPARFSNTLNAKYVRFTFDKAFENGIMLNAGNQAIPYEPYGYQEGWEVRDNQDRLIWGREDELQTATGTLPFKGYALPVKVKSLLGNTVQNGTPAPDNIVTPEMCGVRTGNLADTEKGGLSTSDGSEIAYNVTQSYIRSQYIPCDALTDYIVGSTKYSCNNFVAFYAADKSFISRTSGTQISQPRIISTPENAAFMRVTMYHVSDEQIYPFDAGAKIMLNSGSTALPYEPYGYKIPITCAGQTVPVYLGQTQTVRRVRKLVLTGEEAWSTPLGTAGLWGLAIGDAVDVSGEVTHFCSHFKALVNVSGANFYKRPENTSAFRVTMKQLIVVCREFRTTSDFKSYLAAQYAAGTPVTVWYVLANEQTGIVNEPLCKIGTYADELTTIGVHGLSAPLYGIGDYKDTLNLSTGVVTRKVKKLVLTGSESTDRYVHANTVGFAVKNLLDANYNRAPGICSHYAVDTRGWIDRLWIGVQNKTLYFVGIGDVLGIDTATEFKSYLAAQYAAGTPVTIWYVLNTPTTETVTVPTGMTGEIEGYLTQISTSTPEHPSIPKWNGKEETGGTYAVTVYDLPEIETTTGKNTLTVETEKIHGLTNPLCGIGDYKDILNLSTGIITRKIKKLVFDGTEEWRLYALSGATNVERFYLVVSKNATSAGSIISSHFPTLTDNSDIEHTRCGGSPINEVYIYISRTVATTVSDFKSYLAAQYAAGTPVTVWYAIREPETETITVPYGLKCSVEGYLTQSGTPTPSNPITPDSNGILESGGTYAVEVSLDPSNLTVKGHIKPIQ